MTHDNLVLISVQDPARAYQGLSDLKSLAADGRITIRSAGVVERDLNGVLSIRDGFDDQTGLGTATGGLVGMLVGVLGGPLGMLLGAGTGAMIGSTVDLDRVLTGEEVLAGVNQLIPAGATVLLAELDESAEEVVNGAAANLGGTVTRRPVFEVVAELEAADEAAAAARSEARKTLHAQKRAEVKRDLRERRSALVDKLHHRSAAKASSAS